MRKIKGYPGWAAALLLAFFAMACLLGPPPAQAAGDWTRVDDASLVDFSLNDVIALSPSDVWAGGEKSGGMEKLVHYNGETGGISKVETSGFSGSVSSLWADGPDDIYVAGKAGQYGYIYLFDGEAWPSSYEYKSARNKPPCAIWGSGPDDIYAVGYSGAIVHYKDGAWSAMDSGSTSLLSGVWGSGPGDVYAVGGSGTILHYKDGAWSAMDSGTTSDLWGVWGSGPGDVYAVGDSGAIVHYNGEIWSPMDSGTTLSLNGVWGSGLGDVYAVGSLGTILHYNGETWSPIDSGTNVGLKAVSGSGSEVYVVGTGNGSGIILRYTVQSSIEAPVITPCGGVYEAPQSVTVSVYADLTAGRVIYYTTDGSDPTVAGSVYYTGPFALQLAQGATTVRAAVYDSGGGQWSGVSQAVFTVSGAPAAPEITPIGGVFEAPQSVTVSVYADLTAGRAIYYTTDGSDPTVAGSVYYTGPFTLQLEQGATTVQAAVYDTGSGQWSGVSQAVFTVTGASGPVAPAVTGVSPTWGPVAGGTAVTITGTNLSTVQAVYFGGNAGTGLTVNSGASLTVTSPAGSGTVDVIASGPGGASAATPAARFAYRTSAGELTGERVIATLPGIDAVLPFELYPGQSGSASEPCFITVPAGTGQITIKKDPAKAITSLTVRDANGNAFPVDEGQPYSVTVPAAATRQAPYHINYMYEHYIINIYFYCVEENAPNPFVTPYGELMATEGAVISLNVTGAGSPPQAVEWYYGYNKDSSYEKIYQKLEGETGATLNIAVSRDAFNLGYLDEAYGKYYLRFYAKTGGYISNEVPVVVNETSVTGARSLSADNWGSYAGARQWLNVGAAFGNSVAAGTPVKFYLTATLNGTHDTAVAGTLLETTAAAVPATANFREKDMGFLAGPLPAGEYWLAVQVGTGEAASYRYRPFTVYPGVKEYVKAALDKMISYYKTIGFVKNGTYVGLSVWDDTGTDWKAWILSNYGHTVSDSLLAGADGRTYLDSLEGVLSHWEQMGQEHSAKDDFRFICALSATGADPRDFNGRNLVTSLISHAYYQDGSLKLDANGALVGEVDILSASYLLLGAEIAAATEAERYTDALKKAGIKRILPDVERSVNAQSADDIASSDWLAMMSYPLYFLQGDDEYGARITDAIGKMAAMTAAYQFPNGGLASGWPGASSEGSFDPVIPADHYAANPNSMAVMLNALALFGTTTEDLENEVWQEDWGTLITAFLGLQQEDGSMGFSGSSNEMATYQTLGALVELYTGRSCFVNARETYLSHYTPAAKIAGIAADPSVTMAAGNTAVAAGDNSWTINVVTGTVKDSVTGDDIVIAGLPPELTAAASKGADNTILVTVSGTAGQAVNSLTTVSVVVKGGAVTEPGMTDSLPVKVYLSPAALSAGQVTVTDEQKDITLDGSTPAATVVVPESVTDARINLAPLLTVSGGGKTATLPADLTVQADTAAGRIRVEIPAGTVISATDYWTGAINIPSVRPNDSVTVAPDIGKTATVNSVIEIGFDDLPLAFSKAVRLVFTGQAGKEAGYYRGGVFTKISTVMSSDSQAEGDALPAGGDGRIDVGQDLVIWTKHFTSFVTYTQTATSSGGGSGGGGGGSGSVTVNIRVEGYNDTLVPRTSVSVDNFDLAPYLRPASGSSASASSGWGPDKLPKPTVAHALVRALQSQGLTFDLQDYGWSLYVAMIAGEREFDIKSTSGWMYRVNGTLPNIGCQEYTLKGGEDIVWYFAAYGFNTWYSNLTVSKTSAATGEEITLTLAGSKTDLSGSGDSGSTSGTKLKGAVIYVNGEEYKPDGTTIVTDENGKAVIKFNDPGAYEVSAERFTGEGYRDMVRPLPVKITVTGPSISGGSVPVKTSLAPKVEASNGVASVAIGASDMTDAIKDAKEKNSASIVIAPEITGTAKKVSVELPKASISSIASETDADLTVETPVGSLTIPNSALASIAAQSAGGTVTVSLASVDNSALSPAQQEAVGDKPVYDITIMSGGSSISGFSGGTITVSLPYTLKDGEDPSGVTVWYLNDAGRLEQVACIYDPATGLAAFTTDHLSYYVVGYVEYVEAPVWTNPFSDVKPDDWFYDSVSFAVRNGLFSGTSATTFSPNEAMTRAMLVTVLYRLEGEPSVTGTNSFTDVGSGQWYTGAVIWANAEGIVTGYGGGLFGTNDSVTRQQIAAVLYNYAKHKGYDVTATADLSAYTDAAEISDWAQSAMKWANAGGLINGRTATTLAPDGSATRAEVAAILQRFAEGFTK